MKSIHLVMSDLFLPQDFATEVCAGLQLPALEKILGSGMMDEPGVSLEAALCGVFNVPCQAGAPVASLAAAFDGLGAGYWLRADPVHVRLQRDQVVLLPVSLSVEESQLLCGSLNAHFAGEEVEFFAPHPHRWYVRAAGFPDIETVPMSQVSGRNIHGYLPVGPHARRWHQLFNEIQMLLFAHPLNALREARGEMPVNSVWLWGNGDAAVAQSEYDWVEADHELVEMLAKSANTPYSTWPERYEAGADRRLLVWTGLRSMLQRGDLGAWRTALLQFESNYAQPLWQALRCGQINQLKVDILGGDRILKLHLTRGDTWAFWRRRRALADYSTRL